MHRHDRELAIKFDLQMRSLAARESRALLLQPPFEFGALHGLDVNDTVYNVK